MTDPYAGLATRFVAHYGTLRGAIRETLVSDQLFQHLPRVPARVVDVGGGAGNQAIRLARAGFEVVLVEPSREMRAQAQRALEVENGLSAKVRLVACYGEEAPEVLGGETFDVVCCHGVLPYLDDPRPLVHALAGLGAPGAILSLVFKNRDALAFRPALEGRWRDAAAAFQEDGDVGEIGIRTRAHRLAEIEQLISAAGFDLKAWYGIRVFTDHLKDAPVTDNFPAVLAVEGEASGRDPYRSVARLIHVIGRRR